MDKAKLIEFVLVDADGGRDEVKLSGAAADLAPLVAAYLRTCKGGACLQWPVGAAWSELYLHAGRTLADNLTQAWHELEGIGCPPACLSEDEEAMARAIVPALLSAAVDL